VGTTINLAARVESATVGGEVLATLAVIAQVEASALHIAERRSLRPKGASEPLEVASVQGLGDLRLPTRDEALVAVAPRAVTLFLFKGKELDPEPIVAELVALGPQAVAVRCAAPLDGQSDVLLRIEPGVEAAARVEVVGVVGAVVVERDRRGGPQAGLDLVLVQTWRDPAVQARLYAQGRTLPGKIVTWAQPGESQAPAPPPPPAPRT
jgi:hypothetical protein